VLLPVIFLAALSGPARAQTTTAVAVCPEPIGKSIDAQMEYLRQDRSVLAPDCAATAMRNLGAKRYTNATSLLIKYLDYRVGSHMKAPMLMTVYPAVDALYSLGKPVVADLLAVIASPTTTDQARENAAETILLIYRLSPEGIGAPVKAARAEPDQESSVRLMDQARRLAGRCPEAIRNACENRY